LVEKPPNNDGEGLWAIATHPLNILLVCFPLGMCAWIFEWSVESMFWFNFLAMVPLAKILGDATEELAAAMRNDMLAGLLNATFGNAVEMVMTIIMLYKGKINLVKETLLGSVLSNLLLVLGMSFFCGGLVQQSKKKGRMSQPTESRSDIEPDKNKTYKPIVDNAGPGPSKSSPRERSTSEDKVALVDQDAIDERPSGSRASFADGALAEETYEPAEGDENQHRASAIEFAGEVVQTFSAMTALVNTSMLLLSCLSTSLVTVFAHELAMRTEDGKSASDVLIPVSRLCSIIIILAYVAYVFFQLVTHREAMGEGEDDQYEDDEEEGGATISITTSIIVMFVVTVIVAFSSEALVASVDGVVEGAHMPENFIGIILMPIVGNACEHASAIRFAIQDKPGLSIGIAVGSSTQISLFVVPFSVLIGWFVDRDMDLDFGALNTTVMFISVVVVLSVVVDGRANWLQGYLLISAYLVIGVLYWHLPSWERPGTGQAEL
jgi:Ca2+:H+ antiporter